MPTGTPRRLTMKHIGEMVGVSQSTVSRVLSGAPSVVPVAHETRERILSVVAELGFTPNPLARALRSSRTALLGLIVRDIGDPFFAWAIAAITEEARHAGYNVVLGHVHSSAHEAAALQEVLEMGHCDGAILLGDLRDQTRLWSSLTHRQMPLVGLWQGARAPQIPVVNVDNRRGVELALDHLFDLGHRRIGFLQGGRTGDGVERREAYLASMHDRGVRPPDAYVLITSNAFADTARAVRALFDLAEPPTAVVCSTDVAAIGALKGVSAEGLRVPADLSIVGFDDIPLAEFANPSLTTVRQPIKRIARLAVKQVVGLIGSRGLSSGRQNVVEPSLVVRDSSAAPSAERP